MDVFTDAARQHEIHDNSPGNGGTPGNATGLFWTIAAPDAVHRSGDSVTLQVHDVPIVDTFQLFSSPVAPATLSVIASWSTRGTKMRLSETSLGSTFAFDGITTTVDVQWTAHSQVSLTDATPFTFQSSGPTTTLFARLGHERNGVFAH
ncbi:MAG TPA: hypothetical protein VJP85_05200 [Candidatus Baltobacteraceae bacterium]|nr:hypothetical protein [Candidatus Baltobacteraceae bacterium]